MKASLFFLSIVLLSPTVAAAADDVVVIATGEDKSGRQKMKGRIVRYAGQELVLEQLSGREKSIPAESVVEIQTTWTEPHRSADALLAAGKFDEALKQYRLAMQEEKRRWAQQQIMSQMIWCYRGQGNIDTACETFIKLHGSDPPPKYFEAIPLSWRAQSPPARMAQLAREYLGSSSSVAQLLGASWLLSTRNAKVVDALRRLTNDPDRRIALLAEAQLWQSQIVTADDDQLQRWSRMLQRLPAGLRGGPYYTLGRGLAQRNHHEQAALTLMRVPIFYPQDRTLAADALLATALQLEKLDRPDQARTLYRELLTTYRASPAAAEAKIRLQNSRLENKKP